MIIISIHALLAESDGIGYIAVLNTDISIHALLAESDLQSRSPMILLQISIHALLAESDLCRAGYTKDDLAFLSTLSLRRATGGAREEFAEKMISIHALLAESDLGKGDVRESPPLISIHALLAESDVV